MSRSNLLPGILTLLVMVVWADHAWSRCGHRFGHGNRVRIVRRKVCIPAPLQEPDRGVTLAWKLKKGEPFYQEMTTDVTQKMTVMGQNITQKQKVTFYFTWAPVAKDEDGNWTVKQKIEGVKMEIEIGGNKIPFDSTKKGPGLNPLSNFFKALVGSEFMLTFDKNMKISSFEGRDQFLKNLIKKNQEMEPLLKTILSDEALKQMSDPGFAAIPDKPVKKGDTWLKTTMLNMGPIGSFDTNYKYTYEGPDEKKLQRIKVDSTLKYVPPGPNAGSGLPFKILKADLNSKESKGEILFDSEKGRVASSNMTMKMAGTLTIEIGGMSSDVTLDQTQTTTVKTSDENPIGKK